MKYYIIALLILFNVGLNAQTGFEKIISNTDDQIINCAIEDAEGNFILVGRCHSGELNMAHAYIIMLSPMGELLNEIMVEEFEGSSIFFNIHSNNTYYYLLGTVDIDYPLITKLWYLRLDYNLVKLDEKFLCVPPNRWISYMNSIIDSDGNFVLTGYTNRYDSVSPYNLDAFYYKLSSIGDSLVSVFTTTTYYLDRSFNLIESVDSSYYNIFLSRFDNTSNGHKLKLNKNFGLIDLDPIPLGVYDFYSPIYLDQNEILICGHGNQEPPNDYALNVLSMTEDAELIDYGLFKNELYRDHPAMYQGVSKYGDNIYVGGTSNFDYANPFLSTNDSWFHLIKINPDITPIWEKWYGGDAYYHLYNIVATSDGGCLMVGNRYDYEIQDQERDVYVVKVDSAGLIVWTQEIQMDHPLFTLYPNPGGNQIQIKATNGEFDFELYNLNGQVLIKQQVTGTTNTISTEMLQSGMYFYRLTDKRERIIKTGKWIKK